MKLAWIISLVLGVGLTAYVGGYRSLTPEFVSALADYGFAVAFTGLHVLVWRGQGRFFAVLRFLVWAFYAVLAGLFLWAYFPRGILPVLQLMVSNVTLPMGFGLLAVAAASLFRRRAKAPLVATPSRPAA